MTFRSFAGIMALIASVIPFVLITLRSSRINLPRAERGHQFLMPILAIIYCIPTMLTVNHIADMMIRLTQFFANIVQFVPGIGGILNRFFERVYSAMHLGYGVQLAANTMVMAGFCILKQVAIPILRKLWSRWRGLYRITAGRFYTERGNRSVLQARFANMRTLFNVLYISTVLMAAIDCILVIVFSDSSAFQFPFYPVFAVIVMGEIAFFLNGATLREQGLVPSEEEDDEEEDVDCEELIKEFEKRFKDRIELGDHIPEASADKNEHSWEMELAESDSLDQIAGAYFNAMTKSGEVLNSDYVSAARSLLHGNSVLIYNPFYHDLTAYLLLPIFHELLNHHSCLIVCGRLTNEADIVEWIRDGIQDVTNLPKLWNIAELSGHEKSRQEIDIGVLGFENLYNLENLKENKEFFKKISLVILLEPSNLLGTGQIGLRSVVQYCEADGKELTYCALDRNADGLVDALSHAVRQSITEVIASPTPVSPYCRMFWRAEGPGVQTRILPRISHYLGIGGEIGAFAMNKGVPEVNWYSGSKMPLADMRWNVQQYYAPICQYIHAPREQIELDERFHFYESLWQAEFTSNAFIIVEDEFCNVFEMARTFAARIQDRGFIHVLSENYLLRDYMCGNKELFTNDPKAIPAIVPDYARTERNFVIRTLLLMATDAVDEQTLSRELSLHGYETKFPLEEFCRLITKNIGIEDPISKIQTIRDTVTDGVSRISRFSYTANRDFVESVFDSALKSAHYVIENEQIDANPMGNRLIGHISQTLLPGQFFCYQGKYYQVKEISPENGIIVRRAADHITGRCYYRQLRDYAIRNIEYGTSSRDLRGIDILSGYADFTVTTDGYLEMKDRSRLKEASCVRMDHRISREMAHKEFLQLRMEDAAPEVRFTIAVLLNELFPTIYPNENGYLTATVNELTPASAEDPIWAERGKAVLPFLKCDVADSKSIFLIEDSTIDLGLLVSMERNLQRIFEILADYLDWYLDPERAKTAEDDESGTDEEAAESNGDIAAEGAVLAASSVAVDDVEGEDEEALGSEELEAADLEHADFLYYGYQEVPAWLSLETTLEYLRQHQFDDSNLHRSRKKEETFDEGSDYDPRQPGVHYCDFCGKPLMPETYDILKDGRERCPECSADAVKTSRQFKAVYKETLEEMERVFDIKYDKPIKVRMANAKKVNDGFNAPFKPTPQMDSRVLGYAQRKGQALKILVENGAPRWSMKSTLVHELAHIWQYSNWSDEDIERWRAKHGPDGYANLMEGMAVWSEVQYLVSVGEKERAIRYKRNREQEDSPYGIGMNRYLEKYPVKNQPARKRKEGPFGKFPPID